MADDMQEIEPGALHFSSNVEERVSLSQAISLKRIADSFDRIAAAVESQASIAATSAAYAPATHDLRGESMLD